MPRKYKVSFEIEGTMLEDGVELNEENLRKGFEEMSDTDPHLSHLEITEL